jgi:hypothetical protein
MSVTVACVLRTGRRVVDKQPYRPEHALKLRNGVLKHLRTPHRFVCLTDTPEDVAAEGVEALPLTVEYPGWWAKMNLFAPGVLTGPTLYLDLDSLVVGALDSLVRAAPGITMVPDFCWPESMNSSVMAWCGDMSGLWHAFEDASDVIMRTYDGYGKARVGDQGFIHDALNEMNETIAVFDPAHVVSFKRGCKDGVPPDARVLSFHGRPKCDVPEAGWAYEMWSAL